MKYVEDCETCGHTGRVAIAAPDGQPIYGPGQPCPSCYGVSREREHISPEELELVDAALRSLDARKGEDIGVWAKQAAASLVETAEAASIAIAVAAIEKHYTDAIAEKDVLLMMYSRGKVGKVPDGWAFSTIGAGIYKQATNKSGVVNVSPDGSWRWRSWTQGEKDDEHPGPRSVMAACAEADALLKIKEAQ